MSDRRCESIFLSCNLYNYGFQTKTNWNHYLCFSGTGLILQAMKPKTRCCWSGTDPLYIKYHDEEWGVPVYDDQVFFEFLILETFQAGLSWITILRKRENFREAFDAFVYNKIAQYDLEKTNNLMQNEGIIRNRLKIQAAISNAQAFLALREAHGSFSAFVWNFIGNKPIVNYPKTQLDVPATTELSDRLSKELKKRGFKFVGSTIVYAFMQATGLVDDHLVGCFRKKESGS